MPSPLDPRSLREVLPQSKSPSTQSSTTDWRSASRKLGTLPETERVPLRFLASMRNDPVMAFALLMIKSHLVRAQWHIEGRDLRVNAFVDKALRRIYGRLVLAYFGCLDWGYAPLVKNFERSSDPKGWTYVNANGDELPVWTATADPLIWKAVTALDPRKCSPHFDSQGQFDGIDFGPTTKRSGSRFPFEPGGGQPSIPVAWSLWAINDKDAAFGSLFGRSRLAAGYEHWHSYWYRWRLSDRAFERWADPPVVAYHPSDAAVDPDTGERRNYTSEGLSLAERLRSGANVSLPSDAVSNLEGDKVSSLRAWHLEQMESNVDFGALKDSNEYLDVAKLRSVLIPEQAFFEGKGGTSSRNVASTLGDVFENSQATLLAEFHAAVNRNMIPQLVEANFGANASCEIVSDGLNPDDIETMRTLLQALAQNAPGELASVDPRALLERLNIPQRTAQAVAAIQASEEPPAPPYDQEAYEEIDETGAATRVLDRLWKGRSLSLRR